MPQQCCNAVLSLKLSLRIVSCNIALKVGRRIVVQGFAFLCKLGLLFFKPQWDYKLKFKYERKNEKNSCRSSKMTPACNGLFPPIF